MAGKNVDAPKFYCMKYTGAGFSITAWNADFRFCNDAGIEGEERDRILNPEMFPCKNQCENCINVVLDTRLKNSK